jgi:hypothetical protein
LPLNEIAPGLLNCANSCLNLKDEAMANLRIDDLMRSISNELYSEQMQGTPRPRAKRTPPAEKSPAPFTVPSLADKTDQPYTSKVAFEQEDMGVSGQRFKKPSPSKGSDILDVSFKSIPQKESVKGWSGAFFRQAKTSTAGTYTSPLIRLLLGVILMTVGAVCTDGLYTARHLKLTQTSFYILLVLACWGIILFIKILLNTDRVSRCLALLKIPSIALMLTALELWSVHYQQDYWLYIITATASLTFIISLL